jgi:hypothetical protein
MRRVALLAAVATIAATAGLVPSGAGGRPDSHVQPLIDGCERSNASIALAVNEWVYVHRAQVLAARLRGDPTAGRQTVEGVVTDSKPSGDDQFISHDYVDFSQDVKVDPAYAGLIGTGDTAGFMHTEWEEARVPQWAWPQVGDRVRESGSYIWDCGHWGNGEADPTKGISQFIPYDPIETAQDVVHRGTITGEGVELHPLYEIATFRSDAAGLLGNQTAGTPLQHLDAWISGDGTPAYREEECAMRGIVPAISIAFESTICPRFRDVGGHYSYTIDLGAKPDPASTIAIDPLVVHPETDAVLAATPVLITPDPSAGTVTVSFDLPHLASSPIHFGISLEAGWTLAPAAVHHVITIDKIHVNATLDGKTEPSINPISSGKPKEITSDPGDWVLFLAVNGHWWQIPPDLLSVQGHRFNAVEAGDDFVPARTFDLWLPAGVAPTIFVSGRECDIPLMDCAPDRYGAPQTDFSRPFLELGFNDKPGRVEDPFSIGGGDVPLEMTAGTAIYEPVVNPNPVSSDERFSDAACGGPCYTVTATAN